MPPEKDGAEIEADIAAGRGERFDSMPEAIEGLQEQAEPVAWITRAMMLRLEERGWTEGRLESLPNDSRQIVPLFTSPPASSKEADECEGLREALRKIKKLGGDQYSHAQLRKIQKIIDDALAVQEQK